MNKDELEKIRARSGSEVACWNPDAVALCDEVERLQTENAKLLEDERRREWDAMRADRNMFQAENAKLREALETAANGLDVAAARARASLL